MPSEIERKFLVLDGAWRAEVTRSIPMRQGYLATNERMSVRIRVTDDNAWLTLKSARDGISRSEYEYAIPVVDALEMLDCMVGGGVIAKTRHLVPYAGHTWEVDVFEGENEGLVVAEIELTEADESFDLPVWAGLEVSRDPRYLNSQLSRNPYLRWKTGGPDR